MEFTAENLEKAVCLFYRSEAGQQAEAHKWLTNAQNSPQAWSFVWDLLHPQRGSEVQFFAATTLHTKILKYWNEVPQDHYEVLKKRILESIVSFAMGPKIVLNRLCIALSAYIIHTVPQHWPKAFEELVSSFQPQYLPNVEPERVIWILLEILTVIPEEFSSMTLATSQRYRVKNVLQEVSKDILKVVEMCLVPIPNANFDMSNLTTYLHSARCASAWIQLGGVNIDECTRIMNLLVDLTCFVYWNRIDPEGMSSEEMELTEVTLEALTAVIQHPHTSKYKSYILKHSANILEKFNKILETETGNPEPNKDILTSIYLLLVSLADSHCKLFVETLRSSNAVEYKISDDLFKCILQCSDLPGTYPVDETSSTVTFSFWYTLQDDILSMDSEECTMSLVIVKPYYRQLVGMLLRKSMLPNDEESKTWTLDDKEMFRCYRQDIADTFMYCYNVLNLEMLDILIVQLENALQKCNDSPSHWNWVDSCLHAFCAIAECIEMENLYLPKLMVVLKDIPYANLRTKVLSSALECVGAYSEWMTDHPDVITNVIPLVISGLSNPEVTPSATMALKDLTHNCQKHLEPYTDHILASCQSCLQSGNFKLAECIRLMSSVGKVMSILPVANVMQYLNVIVAPSFEEIQYVLGQPPGPGVATRLITRLKMLSSLYGSLYLTLFTYEDVQPLLVVVQNTMHLYTMIGSKYHANKEVIEVLCNMLKHTLTTLLDDSRPLVSDYMNLLLSVNRETPQPSVLQLSKTLMILFGKEEQHVQNMRQLMTELTNTSLQVFANLSSTNQLSEKSDLIESFFSMLAQVYKKVPDLINNSPSIEVSSVFECAIFCLSMPETQTVKIVATFLCSFISHSRDNAHAAVVQNYGESLLMKVLLSLGGSGPRSAIDVFSDVMFALNKKYCDNLARWLNGLLQQEGFPTTKITSQQKAYFIKMILKEKSNKRKFGEAVMEFALTCRGIIKLEGP
ncbi:PREDICTED: importin-13 [Nicrophorus vespilloides]|uniref:Importin-13 n=1 Tax=Nicrophorus vespilloides TaxID=110193 RepID=A0ABM1MRZ2_NICVS|nr:PREDICTED: importin-13 [Nicrophorus vespilloides]